jgi:hypothetical protein
MHARGVARLVVIRCLARAGPKLIAEARPSGRGNARSEIISGFSLAEFVPVLDGGGYLTSYRGGTWYVSGDARRDQPVAFRKAPTHSR